MAFDEQELRQPLGSLRPVRHHQITPSHFAIKKGAKRFIRGQGLYESEGVGEAKLPAERQACMHACMHVVHADLARF